MYSVSEYYEVVGSFDKSKYDKSIKTNKRIVVFPDERRTYIICRYLEVFCYINKLEDILSNFY